MSTRTILGVAGNVTQPSRTSVLVDAIIATASARIGGTAELVQIADAAPSLFNAMSAEQLSGQAKDIVARVEAADLLVVGTPVYRASYTGALKHLFDLVGYDALVGKPVILAATGGSQLHALVTEHQLRPLFGFFRALTLPTAIYATPSDFDEYRLVSTSIRQRIDRAVSEAAGLFDTSVAFAHGLQRGRGHLAVVQ